MIPRDRHRPSLSHGWRPEGLLPSAAGSGTETGGGVGVEYRPVVLKQFEPEGELVAGNGDGDKPVVLSGIGIGTGAEFGTGAVEEAVGGSWPEAVAVCGLAVAGGEDGAGAVAKPLRSY